MTIMNIFSFLGFYGGIGSLGFLLFVLLAWKTGLIEAARDKEGELKKEFTSRMAIAMGSMLGFYILFLMLSDYFGLGEF